jgi:RimJ/RimL family protein N-acetyltransferase
VTIETRLQHSRRRLSIEVLTPADIDHLRFGAWSRTSNDVAKEAISAYPGRSLWIPDTLEYAIVGSWRHRPEIANVIELSAVRHPTELLAEVVARASALGAALVLSIEVDESRPPAFYDRIDFSMLEEVMTYELDCLSWSGGAAGRLEFSKVEFGQSSLLPRLIELDHRTFPWLWWNSPEEFTAYAASPGVELFLGRTNGEPIAYIGITSFLGWGHLDRIAVAPEAQGHGLGKEALTFAINRLVQLGARRVGLSTQRQNLRSRRLYERAGFHHVTANDYRLYGRILRLPGGVDSDVELI